ncbi:uncharacterized protein L201_005950 [Kwoniella dendrophila CBS 6074]|uniref:Uncharacterized protein n=1 Tax=Kwoniella dendrophila CBS 6074 TaxID=1295534 RepID=A0AAX4K2M7_9TREE
MDNSIDSPISSSSSSSTNQSQPPLPPLRNPKYRHISKSASKRESVQMLGSIKNLQLHFSRAGLVEHRPGAGAGVKGGSSFLTSLDENSILEGEENKPPLYNNENDGNKTKQRRPYKEVELPRINIKDARREAKNINNDIRGIWGLSFPLPVTQPQSTSNTASLPSSKSLYFPLNLFDETGDPEENAINNEIRTSEDIQNALVQTAQSIRRIRFLALCISHQTHTVRKVSGGSTDSSITNRLGGAGKLRSSLSTPSRPSNSSSSIRTVSSGIMNNERKTSLGKSNETGNNDKQKDILGELRKAALEVLTTLRELEENLRVQGNEEEDEMGRSDMNTPFSSAERPFSPCEEGSGIFSSEPDAEEYDSEEDELYNPNNLASDKENNQNLMTNWEDKILIEKREYIDLDDQQWEKKARNTRENIGKWVGVVESLFSFNRNNPDGNQNINHTGDNGQVEDWIKNEDWENRQLEQLHSFLTSNLPLDLTLRLPSTKSDNFDYELLSRLSDGYILIHAYNSSLMRSSKPWGFIPDGDVHDTISSLYTTSSSSQASPTKNSLNNGNDEGRKEKEWTFRKVGNLTCFGAALRHRYQIPISMPTKNLPVPPIPPKSSSRPRPSINTSNLSSSSTSTSTMRLEEKIEFDPMIIAKRTEGWENMLTIIIMKWLNQVVKEIKKSKGQQHLFDNVEEDNSQIALDREKFSRGGMI